MSKAHNNARSLAADLVAAVLQEHRSLTAALAAARAQRPDPRMLAAAQDLAYGVLRHYGRLRFHLDRLLAKPLADVELTGFLLVGLYELDQTNAAAYAVVNEAVAAAAQRFPKARGLVNAVLRNFQRRQQELSAAAEQDPVARWNFPKWWIKRVQTDWPDAWRDILESAAQHPPMTLRINRRRTTVADCLARLQVEGIAAEQTGPWALTLERPVPVSALPGFAEGEVSVQDLGAQAAAELLDCSDGMHVLDACAAPGGKTGHLLEAHALDLVAIDSESGRLGRVRENLDRLGLAARLVAADAGTPSAWWDGRAFDRILLDAPCSASGVVRRHPDGKWLKRVSDVESLTKEQDRLLEALWSCLRPGGKLLYATCSVFRQENEVRVQSFLGRHPDARLEPLNLPGAQNGQWLPNPLHDGFFYARLVKA
ncbi:MAG: 16S rRNA (cytosine(967)-C(5))-methyltransferase RsmB [Hydrogenophilaceae bacterium]|nr:16S rRNA (cytosine(967)-C(5))-methyltransferase RsmB [Hydrogenophilaceae bacterium]